ncbi:MAG: DUF6130 family protein [Actinomycetota bacterium]
MIRLVAHQGTPDETVRVVLVFAGLWVGWVGWDRRRGTGFQRLPGWAGSSLLGVGAALFAAGLVAPALMQPQSPSPGPRPSSTARLKIAEPRAGEVVVDDIFALRIDLSNASLTDESTTDLRPDVGHLHVMLDGRLLTMTSGTEQELDASALAPGPHTLEVEFVAADHAPFDPRVTASVTFEKASG